MGDSTRNRDSNWQCQWHQQRNNGFHWQNWGSSLNHSVIHIQLLLPFLYLFSDKACYKAINSHLLPPTPPPTNWLKINKLSNQKNKFLFWSGIFFQDCFLGLKHFKQLNWDIPRNICILFTGTSLFLSYKLRILSISNLHNTSYNDIDYSLTKSDEASFL